MNYYIKYFSLHEVVSTRCSAEWWKAGLDYLKSSGDVDGWHIMMYGA